MTPSPRSRRRRRVWPWVLLGLGILIALFVADLAWASARAVDGFQQARDTLESGGASLQSGDVATARNDFGAAQSGGEEARGALAHPAVSIAGALPWFSDEIDAARRGAEAIVLAAQGGTAYADAAEEAGWDGSGIPGFAPGGQIDAGAIQRAAPDISKAADLLNRADAELSPIDPSSLRAPLGELVGEAKDEIHARAEQASVAAGLAGLLPPMLGVDGERTYLLVTVSPSDPRGSGGYPGVFGLLHTDGTADERERSPRDVRDSEGEAAGRRPRSTPRRPGAGPASTASSGTPPTHPTSRPQPGS